MNEVRKDKIKCKTKQSTIYHSKEFRALQMQWYKKLDDTGFDDIERSGKNRQKYFNEYSGILKKPVSAIKHKKNANALYRLFNLCRQFSHYSIPLTSEMRNILKSHKLYPSDKTIISMYGNGYTLQQIADYCHKNHKPVRTMYRGNAYSIFYIHKRLKRLICCAFLAEKAEIAEIAREDSVDG